MARRGRKSSSGYSGILLTLLVFVAGLVAGYAARSYKPLPLPVESRLVADKSSEQVADKSLKTLLRSTTERADKAEAERDRLASELAEISATKEKTEQELADLKIKAILTSTAQ